MNKVQLILTLPKEVTDKQVGEVYKAMREIFPEYSLIVSAPRDYLIASDDALQDT